MRWKPVERNLFSKYLKSMGIFLLGCIWVGCAASKLKVFYTKSIFVRSGIAKRQTESEELCLQVLIDFTKFYTHFHSIRWMIPVWIPVQDSLMRDNFSLSRLIQSLMHYLLPRRSCQLRYRSLLFYERSLENECPLILFSSSHFRVMVK